MGIPSPSDKKIQINVLISLITVILKSYFTLIGSFGIVDILYLSWLDGEIMALMSSFVLNEDSTGQ